MFESILKLWIKNYHGYKNVYKIKGGGYLKISQIELLYFILNTAMYSTKYNVITLDS